MEEPFTEEELLKGIKEGIRQRSVTPVFCGCAMNGLGTAALLDNLVRFAPSPLEGKPAVRVDEEGKESEFPLNPDGPATAFVFNTVADQYGKNSYFKVLSGNIEDTMTVVNAAPATMKARQHVLPEARTTPRPRRSAAATSACSRSLPPSAPATRSASPASSSPSSP